MLGWRVEVSGKRGLEQLRITMEITHTQQTVSVYATVSTEGEHAHD